MQEEENNVAALGSQMRAMRAQLNAMLARDPDAPLPPPETIPDPRPLPAADDRLLAMAVDRNPELAALSHEVAGREDALALAKLQWIPDINPSFGFTGSISQMVGAAVMLPTTQREIRGAIRESEAMLEASRAVLEQTRRERAAAFVATLIALRDAERQTQWFAERIIPAAERNASASRQSYSTGSVTLTEVLAAEESVLESKFASARVKVEREKHLARLESLAGVDVETLDQDVP
jgi:outer membrane protein TolC